RRPSCKGRESGDTRRRPECLWLRRNGGRHRGRDHRSRRCHHRNPLIGAARGERLKQRSAQTTSSRRSALVKSIRIDSLKLCPTVPFNSSERFFAMSIIIILALVCGLVGMIASLITRSWFAAVGFLGVALLAADALFF